MARSTSALCNSSSVSEWHTVLWFRRRTVRRATPRPEQTHELGLAFCQHCIKRTSTRSSSSEQLFKLRKWRNGRQWTSRLTEVQDSVVRPGLMTSSMRKAGAKTRAAQGRTGEPSGAPPAGASACCCGTATALPAGRAGWLSADFEECNFCMILVSRTSCSNWGPDSPVAAGFRVADERAAQAGVRRIAAFHQPR